VTAEEIAPLIVAMMKNYACKAAILPPFTEEAQKLFLNPPQDRDEGGPPEAPERKRE
jgi:hypothetical protein